MGELRDWNFNVRFPQYDAALAFRTRQACMRAFIPPLKVTAAVLCCALFAAPAYAAWDFEPTPLEWQSWPVYCRVQYSWVNAGFEFTYGGTVPNETVQNWREIIGPETFTGMHHWCASIHFLNRARGEADPRLRTFELNRASEDAMFSFLRADPSSPVYPNMAVTVAQIREAMGKPEEAEEVLQRGIKAQPKRPEAYVMLALLDRKQHKLAQSRDVLQQADEATAGTSSEIQYNLGLINLELGDGAAAHANALKAYGHGYPLPGLKNLLRKAGRWNDADEQAVKASIAAIAAGQAQAPNVQPVAAPATGAHVAPPVADKR